MCGIAGILRWDRVPEEPEIRRMTDALAHRGPDGEGIHLEGSVALGHRRLAIIDPKGGRQPMCNEDRRVWVTYNGEIYNFRELRTELTARGHRFRTSCDTEVIVHAYEEWGETCVERLRGMFAFAVADLRRRRLMLARDHFGIKPLFYRLGSDYLGFASELQSLRQVDDASPSGSLQAVDYYLRREYIPAPHTIYHDIFKLPPAHLLTVDFDGSQPSTRRYWDFEFVPEEGRSDDEWREEFTETIRESVKAHLVADVPFGVFLSGGNDSTLVALEMSRMLDCPVKAFAMGFEHPRHSEVEYSRTAAVRMGAELYCGTTKGNFGETLPRLLTHYGEPFADSSVLPTWEVSKLAREHVPMVLSGDGGDEAFAGYKHYRRWLRGLSVPGDSTPPDAKSATPAQAWAPLPPRFNSWERRLLWRPEFHSYVGRTCEVFSSLPARVNGVDWLAAGQYADYQTYLPFDILTKVDIASMYHGLEVRTPYVDLRVVELARRLPIAQRVRYRAAGGLAQKYLLKSVLQQSFSADFVHRPKQGFSIPRTDWLSPGTAGRRFAEAMLLDTSSLLQAWFVPAEIERCLHRQGSVHLWILLVLGLWLRQNTDICFV